MNHEEPYEDDYLANILSSVKTIAMVGIVVLVIITFAFSFLE